MLKTVFAVAGILAGGVYCADAWDQAPMNTQIDQTNFLLNTGCSATLIDKVKGYLLTANHCIRDQYTVIDRETVDDKGHVTTEKVRIAAPGTVSQLFFAGPNEVSRTIYVFKIVKSDSDLDLALVQVTAKLPNVEDARISCAQPVRGDKTYAVGNTLGFLYSTVTEGIVSSVNRSYRLIGVDSDNGMTQTTNAIGGGNSGGSLYNNSGEIIGVVVRGSQAIAPIALSVPLSDIQTFVKDVDPDKVTCQ
jgi:S1-C subfamily serine protease